MKSNNKLKNKIKKQIKEFEYLHENIDDLYRSGMFSPTKIRDEKSIIEGKISSLLWVLDQLETKKKTIEVKSCQNCPFLKIEQKHKNGMTCFCDHDMGVNEFIDEPDLKSFPSWCPL